MSATTQSEISIRGRAAARAIRSASTDTRDAALVAIATRLETDAAAILAANAHDVAAAIAEGTSAALIDRLTLDEPRLAALSTAVRDVAALSDPLARVIDHRRLPHARRRGRPELLGGTWSPIATVAQAAARRAASSVLAVSTATPASRQ